MASEVMSYKVYLICGNDHFVIRVVRMEIEVNRWRKDPLNGIRGVTGHIYYVRFGFLKNGNSDIKDGSFLVIAWFPADPFSGLVVVLWCANRDNPVRENATLHFTADSGLELKDVDGTLIWSPTLLPSRLLD
ncbi:hypothetical protein LguiA_007916 [Lonicera macranthoides]